MAETERRRRRPAVSCALCRRRKVRCNRESPCSNCVRSRNATCVYELDQPPSYPPRLRVAQAQAELRGLARSSPESAPVDRDPSTSRASGVPSHPASSVLTTSTSASSVASQPSTQEVEFVKRKIRQLEEQLAKAIPTSAQPPVQSPPVSTPKSSIETTTSRIAGTFHVHHETPSPGQPPAISRSVMHKKRLFGQSHWVNGLSLIQNLAEIFEPHSREETQSIYTGIQRCKSLARIIKSRRTPPWPSPPTAELPPKTVTDELVDGYLRTSETFYRILHVPTFKRRYETIWVSGVEPDTAFLVQLKLVLAIGATVYDEQFSLRPSAIRWMYEAQTWLGEPKSKSRLGVQSLQTEILHLLAREMIGVGGDPAWVAAGALLRRAVYMGFHRDPARLPNRTVLATEMHRRLWNTILEVALQSSLTAGGPPSISIDDFDTEPPGNFDDEQLAAENPLPKPEGDFTHTSVAIALRKTFPLRLAVAKFLNDIASHGTYEETLRLDAELRASYKALCRTLQGHNSGAGPSPSRFATRVVDFIMHRYLSALHAPFFGLALQERAYAFSRKVVVETSLKLWCAAAASPSTMAATTGSGAAASAGREDLERLASCGSGFYRTVAVQAALFIMVELRTQLQEEESLGPVSLRPDLLSVLNEAKAWSVRCIEAGETNVKGYLFICAIAAQVEGPMQGLGKDGTANLLVEVAEDSIEKCLSILEGMVTANQDQAGGTADELHQMSLNATPGVLEDWDLMMPDTLFDSGGTEPMSWMFYYETMQEPALW